MNIIEEIINEISNELADRVHDKRIENVRNSKTEDELATSNEKLKKNFELMKNRDHRHAKNKEFLDKFKEFYKDRGANIKDVKKAGEEHADAQINQGLRNKLEKIYAMESFTDEELFSLMEDLISETTAELQRRAAKNVLPKREQAVSNVMGMLDKFVNKIEKHVEQRKDIPQSLVDKATEIAKQADTAQSRLKHAQKLAEAVEDLYKIFEGKPINFRREQIAKEVNRMMMNGETDNLKQTSSGNILGDPKTVKKLTDMKNELKEMDKKEEE